MRDRFVDLKNTIEEEMRRTGFYPAPHPPAEKEPELPASLSGMAYEDMLKICDELQTFYNYITDEITRCIAFEGSVDMRLRVAEATARRRVTKDKTLPNDKIREAEITLDEGYLDAMEEVKYFEGRHKQLEERRRKHSKSLDRLYREMNLRGQDTPSQYGGQHYGRAPMPKSGFQDGFKPTRTLVVPGGADPAAPLDK